MMVIIKAEQKLSCVQEKFSGLFPYLKLEFFKCKHDVYKPNFLSDILNTGLILKKARNNNQAEGIIVIKETMSVFDLERAFEEHFGISPQVFRK